MERVPTRPRAALSPGGVNPRQRSDKARELRVLSAPYYQMSVAIGPPSLNTHAS